MLPCWHVMRLPDRWLFTKVVNATKTECDRRSLTASDLSFLNHQEGAHSRFRLSWRKARLAERYHHVIIIAGCEIRLT